MNRFIALALALAAGGAAAESFPSKPVRVIGTGDRNLSS